MTFTSYLGMDINANNDSMPTIEDTDFIKMVINIVGWSPLTENDNMYRNPWVKYEFYRDVFSRFHEFLEVAKSAGNVKMQPRGKLYIVHICMKL